MIETKKISLKTLSPIHIKGKNFNYGEGFVRRNDSSAYVLSISKLFNFIHERIQKDDLLYKYNDMIDEAIKNNKLKEFDNEKFLSDEGIYDYQKNKSFEKSLIDYGVFCSVVNITKENGFIKDGKDRPYIPGTSIKGAIRTALLNYAIKYYKTNRSDNYINSILDNFNAHLDTVNEQLEKAQDEREENQIKKNFLSEMEQTVLQTNQRSANKDLLRSLKISDSLFLTNIEKKEVVITSAQEYIRYMDNSKNTGLVGRINIILGNPIIELEKKNINISKNMTKDKIDLLMKNQGRGVIIKELEKDTVLNFDLMEEDNTKYKLTIKNNDDGKETRENIETFFGETEIEISLDRTIFNSLKNSFPFVGFNTLDELMEIVNSFYMEVWEFEMRFFNNIEDDRLDCSSLRTFYNKEHHNLLRFGWGSGLPAVSLFLEFDKIDQTKLRNILFDDRGHLVAPKSRRLIFENNILNSPLGWSQFGDIR